MLTLQQNFTENMKKTRSFLLFLSLFMMFSCGSKQNPSTSTLIVAQQEIAGDSTLYGLACDGCTDTILVILRDIKADPDTLNILNATRNHRIFGTLSIGDKVAVVLNRKDSAVADLVIDMESLRGKWCYEVMPTLRKRADMTEQVARQQFDELPDSLRDLLMMPREYGFHILGERNIKPVGRSIRTQTDDEESPVEYPVMKQYRDWHLYNGRLVLSETSSDSLGQQHITSNDTAKLVMLTPDTLVLRFADGTRGYYNKKE